MKRLIALGLCLSFLVPLAGCSLFSEGTQEPVQFYYQRREYQYGQADAVIGAEERDGTGHITDPEYLLQLYLLGPHSEDLVSPFPVGLQVTDVKSGGENVRVTLTDSLGTLDKLPQSRKTLVFSCLALTCFDITGISNVTMVWEGGSIVMSRDTLTLYDISGQPQAQ